MRLKPFDRDRGVLDLIQRSYGLVRTRLLHYVVAGSLVQCAATLGQTSYAGATVAGQQG